MKPAIVFFILIFSPQIFAFGGGDYTKRESLIGGQFNSYYGERDASFVGSYGQGLLLSTVKSESAFRFLLGAQILFADGNAYIADTSYNSTMLSVDLLFGISIKPYKNSSIQPVFELAVMGGFKSLEFASPPAGVETKDLGLSYGGKVSLGLDVMLGRSWSLRPAIDYQTNRLSGIVDNETFVLDALGFSLSLVFM